MHLESLRTLLGSLLGSLLRTLLGNLLGSLFGSTFTFATTKPHTDADCRLIHNVVIVQSSTIFQLLTIRNQLL